MGNKSDTLAQDRCGRRYAKIYADPLGTGLRATLHTFGNFVVNPEIPEEVRDPEQKDAVTGKLYRRIFKLVKSDNDPVLYAEDRIVTVERDLGFLESRETVVWSVPVPVPIPKELISPWTREKALELEIEILKARLSHNDREDAARYTAGAARIQVEKTGHAF